MFLQLLVTLATLQLGFTNPTCSLCYEANLTLNGDPRDHPLYQSCSDPVVHPCNHTCYETDLRYVDDKVNLTVSTRSCGEKEICGGMIEAYSYFIRQPEKASCHTTEWVDRSASSFSVCPTLFVTLAVISATCGF